MPIKIQVEVSEGKFETAIDSIYTIKVGATLGRDGDIMDYKIDGEIRTLDLSKVEIEDELDEDTIEDILDSFKLLFSSGITKGKVNIGENSLISEYLNGLALKSFEFSFKKDEEVLINFDGFDRVTPISAIQ